LCEIWVSVNITISYKQYIWFPALIVSQDEYKIQKNYKKYNYGPKWTFLKELFKEIYNNYITKTVRFQKRKTV
jgi:hypothetical protein